MSFLAQNIQNYDECTRKKVLPEDGRVHFDDVEGWNN
jgi:hypothetical protein